MTAPMAASAVFDRGRTPAAVDRDRRLLNAMAQLDEFTADEASRAAVGDLHAYTQAGCLIRALRDEGHLVRVPKPYKRPHVYRWAEA